MVFSKNYGLEVAATDPLKLTVRPWPG